MIADLGGGFRIMYRLGTGGSWWVSYPGSEDFKDPSFTLLGARFCVWRYRRRIRQLQRLERKTKEAGQ